MTAPLSLAIDPEGGLQFIYDDELVGLLELGPAKIERVSHVEPAPGGGWSADMAPVGGPLLGPFPLRGEALAAEVAWLHAHGY
jgi:hypothetical protein